jgi:hypothetical protein
MEYMVYFFHIIIYTPKERKRTLKSGGTEENNGNFRIFGLRAEISTRGCHLL